jgi:hypothetical protein
VAGDAVPAAPQHGNEDTGYGPDGLDDFGGDGELDNQDIIREEVVMEVEEEEPIPAAMGPSDPPRRRLTREESQWALDIKYAIENLPEVDNLDDFWYDNNLQ